MAALFDAIYSNCHGRLDGVSCSIPTLFRMDDSVKETSRDLGEVYLYVRVYVP